MKLTRIDWYIIKRFLGAFLLTLGLFTIIIIVFDLSEKIDNFIENSAPTKDIFLKYYINWVPFLLNLFSPVFVFISVIFFTSKMAQKSEIVSILAAGVSYRRLMVPYFLTGLLLAVFSFTLSAFIIPKADKTRVKFENQYIRDMDNFVKSSIKRQIEPGVIMSVGNFNFSDSAGYKFNLEKIENSEITSKLFADRLNWNDEKQTWRLTRYWIRTIENGKETLERGDQLDTMVNFNPEDFFRMKDDVQMFNLKELDEMIDMEILTGTGKTYFYLTEKYKRFVAPISIIVLTIIGLTVASRKRRGGIGLNLGVGLLISFTYLIVIQFFSAYGSSGTMAPLLAVSIPNIIFSGVAFVMYKFAQK